MKENIIADTLKDTLNNTTQVVHQMGFWMWIAIIEFLVIIVLFYQWKKQSKNSNFKQRMKEKSLNEEIDFGNIIQSSFHTQPLYDELKVKCHPDRFPNDEQLNKRADAIFQEITKNKTNFKKLVELKERAKQELNLTF